MRLFRLVKKERAFGRSFSHRAKVADFPKARPKQETQGLLVLKFRHVKPKQLPRAEYLSRRHQNCFRFAHTRWSEQQKAAARTVCFCQAKFTPANGGNDSRQGVGLTANLARQQRVQFAELGEFR
jgi:hypothetical protein